MYPKLPMAHLQKHEGNDGSLRDLIFVFPEEFAAERHHPLVICIRFDNRLTP